MLCFIKDQKIFKFKLKKKVIVFLGKKFESDKFFFNALREFYGIGFWRSKEICFKFGIGSRVKIEEIDIELLKVIEIFLKKIFMNVLIGEDLLNYKKNAIELKYNLKTYEGLRFKQGLPIRGQRSKTNAKTAKRLNVLLRSQNVIKNKKNLKDKDKIRNRKNINKKSLKK